MNFKSNSVNTKVQKEFIIGITSNQLLVFAVLIIVFLICGCIYLNDKCNKLEILLVGSIQKFDILDGNLRKLENQLNNLEGSNLNVVPVGGAVNFYDSPLMRDLLHYFVLFVGIILALGALSYATSYILGCFQQNFLVKSLCFVNTKLMSLFNQVQSTPQSDVIIADFVEYVEPITNCVIRRVLVESDGLAPGLYVNHLNWGWKTFDQFLNAYVQANQVDPLVAADALEEVTAGLSAFM